MKASRRSMPAVFAAIVDAGGDGAVVTGVCVDTEEHATNGTAIAAIIKLKILIRDDGWRRAIIPLASCRRNVAALSQCSCEIGYFFWTAPTTAADNPCSAFDPAGRERGQTPAPRNPRPFVTPNAPPFTRLR